MQGRTITVSFLAELAGVKENTMRRDIKLLQSALDSHIAEREEEEVSQ